MERGYVLHTRPFKDSSVLVNVLVDGRGRVDCVARLGSGKSSIKSILQPFQPLIFQLSGRSSLKTLSMVEAASPAVPLSGEVSFAGFYLNELMVRCITVDHGAEALFYTYHKTLMAMAAGFCESQLRYFELALLKELGLMPTLTVDLSQEAIEPDYYYRLLPDEGFINALGPKLSHYSGEMLLALNENRLELHHLKQAKYLMRLMLAPCLGDKPLKSRALFKYKTSNPMPK
ncbi:DNA repair protein RecO [Shewanella sp. UCD-KL12]|uniref:DNA repair protein RecO n=1 Tax=Shewanella sp. UCD-KL12 TaxID=1917163 RepID=UPI000970CA07|nr:DNA repair protein RecO [Shewanella sp. UCD-KL12]